jgi:Tol biopolymer transport system component
LRDGRILVDRLESNGPFKSFLLTPLPGKRGNYQEVGRPTQSYWHKLSLSPSETKVAYMLDNDNNIPTYNDDVICYAEFDIQALKIHRQVQVTHHDTSGVQEYPAWNRDESLLVYDSNETGTYQVYAYRLADGVTIKLSPDKNHSDQFADFEGLPK